MTNSGRVWLGTLTLAIKYGVKVNIDTSEVELTSPDDVQTFQTQSGSRYSSEDIIQSLENEKQSLDLQVSVLLEQVEAQAEKIRDMESFVEDYRRRVADANDVLHQELLTRSSIEYHKFDLMAEVSQLKVKLTATERDRKELDDRCRAVQRQVADLESKLMMRDAENTELRLRLGRNGKTNLDTGESEVEKLRRAIDALMLANEEKERKLEEMRRMLKRYRKVEEILIQAQGRKVVEDLLQSAEDGDISSNSSSTTPSFGDTSLRDQQHYQHPDNRLDGRHYFPASVSTSSPMHHISSPYNATPYHGGNTVTPFPVNSRQTLGMTRSNSCENVTQGSKVKVSTFRKMKDSSSGGQQSAADSYGTLPKHHSKEDMRESKRFRGFHSLGKTLRRVRSGKRSSSAPNLANTEAVTDDEENRVQHSVYDRSHADYKKRHGLRRLLGRLRRSSSQDFEGSRERRDGDFKRGGTRATASSRLAWNRDVKGHIMSTDIPFARWDTDRVTAWMNDIGLNMYLVDCKRWVKNGEQLLRASQHDLERELGMKNILHRKKLQLSMQAMASESSSNDGLTELDHNFVARWLDDIGLPQYKDSFYDARIDGRMLNYLTVEDLFSLKVYNEVHHVSIKRGIQILRLNNFNPNCLRRRPAPDEQPHPKGVPGEVVLWSNHRVMEWLRTIDLSEYAPNLRGSGVHGAVMVLEPRFNSELFAVLLSIPGSKTLLRRHLNTHFISLIGPETQTRKREYESQPGYVPLLSGSKLKKGKFALFGHKRAKSDSEAEVFICPIELNGQYANGKRDDKAAREIGAFSKEINSLTNRLSQERFINPAKTSNV